MKATAALRCVAWALAAVAALPAGRLRAAPIDWSIELPPDGEIFPILDLSRASTAPADPLGGGAGLVAIHVRSRARGELRLEVTIEGLRAPTVVVVPAAQADQSIEIRPRFDWDIALLRALPGPLRTFLRVILAAPGGATEVREWPVRLHPPDDALYFVRDEGERVDLGWIFAAYVDPASPVVDEILALARARDTADFPATATAAQKLARVRAVWGAIEAHGLRYADGDPQLSRGPKVYSQRVRLLSDSWQRRRANCIDASVLIASVLERLRIPSFIVLVPGHAFVGFYTGEGHREAEFLETTLIGARSPRANDAGRFQAALRAGRARFQHARSKLDGRHRPDYAVIDIGTARAYGIIPLTAEAADDGKVAPASDRAAASP